MKILNEKIIQIYKETSAHEAKCVNTSEASPQTDEDRVGRIALAPSDSLASHDEMSDSAGARSDLPGVIHKI
jgi:hypothetical protein